MKTIERSRIEKLGRDNGFELLVSSADDWVVLASARHPLKVAVNVTEPGIYRLRFIDVSAAFKDELQRHFDAPIVEGDEGLAALLRCAAKLGAVMPDQVEADYRKEVVDEIAALNNTEVERLVRERVGQERFRKALLDYWGGACAVTGVAISEVLRASHAKPWAACESDAERLDVYNGFLLTANLDALFDRFLISFADDGALLVSPRLSWADLAALGVTPDMRLRWLAAEHLRYLRYHRRCFYEAEASAG